MEPTMLDGVNTVIANVNETIQAAKEQNDSVVGTILLDEEEGELITIAATPKGELLSYVFHGVPLIVKETDSPRALAEDLLNYIDNFYAIGAEVECEIELDEETAEELGDKTAMAVAIRTGDF